MTRMRVRTGNANFFLEQWERVIRWYHECEMPHFSDGVDYLDVCEAFFINAYHLRDWLEQWFGKTNKEDLKKKMTDDFNNNEYLQVLRDLCLGTKHFTLTRKPAIAGQFAIINQYILGEIVPTVLIGGHMYQVNELRCQVFLYWRNFMEENKLDKLKHQITGPLIP